MKRGVGSYFDGEFKECSDCYERKPLSEFHPAKRYLKRDNPMSSDFRSRCKKCRNINSYQRQKEKLIELFPYKYWECERCDIYIHSSKLKCSECGLVRKK